MRSKVDWRHLLGAVAVLAIVGFLLFRLTLGRDPSIPTESAPAGANPSARASDEPR